eukprot:scaffold260365_cov20-Tisochrysis_lutea.AAC.1
MDVLLLFVVSMTVAASFVCVDAQACSRGSGPQQWIWQELKSMAEMKFMFLVRKQTEQKGKDSS